MTTGDGTVQTPARPEATPKAPPALPAVLLGIGLGGFVDEVVLHQILQVVARDRIQ